MSETFSVDNGTTELVINGRSVGRVSTNGQTVGAFVTAQARQYGLKSFSVYVDGTKFFTEQANNPLSASKVEIVAKDARGLMVLSGTEGPTPATVKDGWDGKKRETVEMEKSTSDGDSGDKNDAKAASPII